MEIEQWLKSLADDQGADQDANAIVDDLISEVGMQTYSYFSRAVGLANKINGETGDVPSKLRKVILVLGDKPSGFTGLTNWGAWAGFNSTSD